MLIVKGIELLFCYWFSFYDGVMVCILCLREEIMNFKDMIVGLCKFVMVIVLMVVMVMFVFVVDKLVILIEMGLIYL